MPLYAYRCPEDHETERFVVYVKDTPKTVECVECGLEARRIIAPCSFRMKGSVAHPDTAKQAWEGTPLEDGSEMIDKYEFMQKGPKVRVGV